MSTSKRIKVTDFATLQLEKQRLKAIYEAKRINLEVQLDHLKKNYPEIAMKTFLPFDDRTNDKIVQIAKWIHDTAMDYLGGSNTRLGKLISGKGSNLLQAGVIYLLVRFARNMFFKGK